MAFPGCGQSGKVAAVVNGQVITTREIEERMARLNPTLRAAFGNDPRRLLDEMVLETILLQEARRKGLQRDPQVRELMEEANRQILVGRLLETFRGQQAASVAEEEVRKFYDRNPEAFTEPEALRASHILADSEEQAQAALERLKKGEPFEEVAKAVSKDPTSQRGGDLGFFSKGQVIPEFEEACRKLRVGERSGVVKTSLGHHIILLTERRSSRQLSLKEVEPQIRKQLSAQQQQRQVEEFIQGLRSKAQISIHEKSLSPATPSNQQPSAS